MVPLRALWTDALCLVAMAVSGLLTVQPPHQNDPPIQRRPTPRTLRIAFSLPMEITNRVFSDALLNPASDQYQTLYKEVSDLVKSIFDCPDYNTCPTNIYYGGVTAMTFSSGSVIATPTIAFNTYLINPSIIHYFFSTRADSIQPQTLRLNLDFTTKDKITVFTSTTTTTHTPSTTTTVTTTATPATPTITTTTTATPTPATTDPTTTATPATATTTAAMATPPTTTITTTTIATPTPATTSTATTTTPETVTTTANATPATTTITTTATTTTSTVTTTTTPLISTASTTPSSTTTTTTDRTTSPTNAKSSPDHGAAVSPTNTVHGNQSGHYITNRRGSALPATTAELHNKHTESTGEADDDRTPGDIKSNQSWDRIPGWGSALLALAAAILLLLIIIFIMMLVQWCCKKTENGHINSIKDLCCFETKQLLDDPLAACTPPAPVTQGPGSAPVTAEYAPRKNRIGFYAVNP